MAEPGGLLAQIARRKREELEMRFAYVSLDALRAQARPTRLSLAARLNQPGSRFILEIKKASPSAGTIRPDADVREIARGYAGVADALSVLTDGEHFSGSLEDIARARPHFDGPILAKEFFMDARQVIEARIAGADAVLVMMSLLDDSSAREIIDEARRLNMDALVEVHDEREMRRALAIGAPLIGINNRDLRDLSIDLSTTERLARLAPDRILVSESGIADRSDVERLSSHVDAFLIGSMLMRAEDPAQAARNLLFGRVKLCGINCGDALRAARPAAFVGFVFVADSPRDVTARIAAPLADSVRECGSLPVGIFRDAPAERVVDIATALNLHSVQLHGQEDEDYVRQLRRLLPEAEIWTSVSVGRDARTIKSGDRFVFDNGAGGSGRTFNWALVENHPDLPRSLVAGGIGPHNAAAAQKLGGYAIDVGSSVEDRPGTKSPAKIAALFDTLRPASRPRLRACA